MKINPVYGKEVKLRVRSLKFAMTILFFNLGLVAIALLGFEMIFNININYRIDYSGAIVVYFVIICIEAAMVAFLVPVFTAGSIAGEREKQTLEILLTTVLKPGQIVIGKLMSSISMVVLLVFSSLPIISIIFTIGGINMADLCQFVIFIIVMSLFIGSMGVCASAMVKKAIPATVISFVMLGFVCGVTAIAILVANEGANIYYYTVQNSSGDVPDVTWVMYFLLINPAFTMFHMVSEQFMGENVLSYMASGLNGRLLPFVQDYWFLCSIVLQLVFTAIFLKLAALFLDPLRRKEKARKNSNNTKKKKKAAMALVLLILAIAPASTNMASASIKTKELDSEGKIKIGKEDISAVVRLGYKGKAKYNRSIRADAVIDNKGSDFTGKFRVEYDRTDANGYVAIQKEFAVAAGESKKVQFTLPAIAEDRNIRVAICDQDDDIVCYEYTKLSYKDNIDTLYIGTLSDSQDSLKYISSGLAADKTSFGASDEGIIFELSGDDITEDDKMIDVLDVIIIDNFDTGKFSKGQINAIKKWVNKGGTLFLGSGADAGKVLDAFSGTLLKGTIGSAESINTNFGVTRAELTSLLGENLANKRVPLDITQIDIKGSKPVLTDGRNNLVSVKEYGSGNIITAEFSLALSPGASRLYGPVIVDVIRNNISEQRKESLSLSNGNTWQSYMDVYMNESDLLNLNSTDSLPNLKLYAVILLIYVFLAGPLSYIVLKKKDKRNLLWFIVPVLSVVFSVTIYLIGTSTRIQKPFINYSSTIELSEKGNTRNNVNTTFSITNSSSKAYETVLPENTSIIPSTLNGYYSSLYYSSDDEAGEYDYGIEYGTNNIILRMNNLSAFESVPFEMDNKSSNTGTVEVNVQKTDDKMSGFITNKMSCGLEDCIFYCRGTMFYIESIPSGKSIDISKQKSFKEDNYSYSFESQLSAAMGGSYYDNSIDVSLRRKIGMVQVFVSNNKLSDTWFYGFVPGGEETSFTDKFSYDKYGETGVYKQVQIQETLSGYDVIGLLEQYAYQFDENNTNGFYIYDSSTKELEVTYKFPKNFTLKRIIYNKDITGGAEFRLYQNNYTETAFLGVAKVKDKTTGKYVKLLESAKKADKTGMEKYLNDDGSLTVYYEIDRSGYYEVDSYILPRVKLAGTYKKAGKRR
ncbi:MAG: ABC transporter permease subunit [Lachnospiraceae bacterium]|nr:ABC transporter permease subunit [Lachnospiraceae bacterium]